MSETPRTNTMAPKEGFTDLRGTVEAYNRMLSISRQLERELAQAQAENAELRKQLEVSDATMFSLREQLRVALKEPR